MPIMNDGGGGTTSEYECAYCVRGAAFRSFRIRTYYTCTTLECIFFSSYTKRMGGPRSWRDFLEKQREGVMCQSVWFWCEWIWSKCTTAEMRLLPLRASLRELFLCPAPCSNTRDRTAAWIRRNHKYGTDVHIHLFAFPQRGPLACELSFAQV